jgi:hypothetical protein
LTLPVGAEVNWTRRKQKTAKGGLAPSRVAAWVAWEGTRMTEKQTCGEAVPSADGKPSFRFEEGWSINTVNIFQCLPCGPKERWGETALQWTKIPEREKDGTQPTIRLIRMLPGSFYYGKTDNRPLVFLCASGAGNVTIELLDRYCDQHINHVVPFASEFTDAIAIPPYATFRFWAGTGALDDAVPTETHLIAVHPGPSWPQWAGAVPEHVNPGAPNFQSTDFRRNYEALSRAKDRPPTPFFVADPNQRARRHRIWGREGLDISGREMGARDWVKPFTHLVLYTFYLDQKNFEHYHPHSWEFVYCMQGEGTMRLRPWRDSFDPKDTCTWPYRPSDKTRKCKEETSSAALLKAPQHVRPTTQSLRDGFSAPRERARRQIQRDRAICEPASEPKACRPPDDLLYDPELWGENWYSWGREGVCFELKPGTAVLVPRSWLHEYEGKRSSRDDGLLLVYAMQTPQPIMHLLEHEANGWNPHSYPLAEKRK